ncbi:hypothetical protein [Psychromonas sp.]|uniref:hypothetical protein n=1 Tax=Psychromonas sp. TaxID=1884585 RepID=UPI003561CEB3
MRLPIIPELRSTLLLVSALLALAFFSSPGFAGKGDKTYQLEYRVVLQPLTDSARVTIHISDGGLLNSVDFNIDPQRYSDIKADGKVSIKDGRAVWEPPEGAVKFEFTAKISSKRDNGKYDARITEDWAIFRGDNLIPAAAVKAVKGATSEARLNFQLPSGWSHVDTGWPRDKNGSFIIDNPQRNFDRPVGWIIAGKVGTRRDFISGTEISVAAPRGSALQRMDVLAFFNFVWPQVERTFHKLPPKLLIVGAGDPMWRGGLSASNSLFLHADRPLVSENGTSSLLHELVHVITRISAENNADWIVEGLAEYYSIELLYRSGGMTDARYQKVRRWLINWSKKVTTLRVKRSSGPTTARAVVLLQDLDREIRERTGNQRSLDDVTRELMQVGKVSLKILRSSAEGLAGGKLATLESELL